MRKLNEWAKGKPQGLVIMAQQFAVGAEPCFEFLKKIKSGDKTEAFSSLPKAKEWVRLYRNHRRMETSLIECLRGFGKNVEVWAEVIELIFPKRKTLRNVLEDIKKQFETMRLFERRRFTRKSRGRA